jgi:hypothetical protein
MMIRKNLLGTGVVLLALVVIPLALTATATTANHLRADPWVFVGNAGDCGPGYAAGANIVTSGWLGGMGLPDNGGQNVGPDPTDNPNKNDPHKGLLLNKNGTTPDCSSSGAEIRGVQGMSTTGLVLGFDYRNGGHCGAGAPRFNVTVDNAVGPDTFHFVGGCANDTAPVAAPQDPLQWTRVSFQTNGAESFPPILPGGRVKSIDIVYDEGTDTANNDTQGVGLAVIDNIAVNDHVIRSGNGIAEPTRRGGHNGHQEEDDDNGHGNGNGNGGNGGEGGEGGENDDNGGEGGEGDD